MSWGRLERAILKAGGLRVPPRGHGRAEWLEVRGKKLGLFRPKKDGGQLPDEIARDIGVDENEMLDQLLDRRSRRAAGVVDDDGDVFDEQIAARHQAERDEEARAEARQRDAGLGGPPRRVTVYPVRGESELRRSSRSRTLAEGWRLNPSLDADEWDELQAVSVELRRRAGWEVPAHVYELVPRDVREATTEALRARRLELETATRENPCPCHGRCCAARGPDCDCVCHGENHGRSAGWRGGFFRLNPVVLERRANPDAAADRAAALRSEFVGRASEEVSEYELPEGVELPDLATLGELVSVTYRASKDHLGDDGEPVDYVHEFGVGDDGRAPVRPILAAVPGEPVMLVILGGDMEINGRGIVN